MTNMWVQGLIRHKSWVVSYITWVGHALFNSTGGLVSIFSQGDANTFNYDYNVTVLSFGVNGIRVWNTDSIPFTVQASTVLPQVGSFAEDADNFYFVCYDDRIRRVKKSNLHQQLWINEGNPIYMHMMATDTEIFAGRGNGDVQIFNSSSFVLKRTIVTGATRMSTFSIDGSTIFHPNENSVERRSLIDNTVLITYSGHTNPIVDVLVSGDTLYTASWDTTVKKWDIQSGSLLDTFFHPTRVLSIALTGNSLYVAVQTNGLYKWDLVTRQFSSVPNGLSTAVSISGSFLFSSGGGSLKVMNLDNHNVISTLSLSGSDTVATHLIYGDYAFISVYSNVPDIYHFHWPSESLVRKYSGHYYPYGVFGLTVSGNDLISGADSVRQWVVPEITPLIVTSTISRATRRSSSTRKSTGSLKSISATTRVDEEATADSTPVISTSPALMIVVIVASLFFFAAILITLLMTYRRRRTLPIAAKYRSSNGRSTANLPTTSTNKSFPNQTSEMFSLSSRSNQTLLSTPSSMQTYTAVTTSLEISIPAFLELQNETDFRLGAFVTKGGMGSLYEAQLFATQAQRRATNSKVIAKVVGPAMEVMSESERLVFIQELSLAWRFRDHPNILRVYGYCTRPVSLLMKLYELGDYSEFISGQGRVSQLFRYSKRNLLSVIFGSFSAIAHMHRNGVVHCDIKPLNILLDIDVSGRLIGVITDFGISRVVEGTSMKVGAFTLSNVKGASILYAAPDALLRFRNKINESDPRLWKAADVFSLGATLYEVLQRCEPWPLTT